MHFKLSHRLDESCFLLGDRLRIRLDRFIVLCQLSDRFFERFFPSADAIVLILECPLKNRLGRSEFGADRIHLGLVDVCVQCTLDASRDGWDHKASFRGALMPLIGTTLSTAAHSRADGTSMSSHATIARTVDAGRDTRSA